ncbi:hypothetical protein CPB85DRAFT_1278606 [Mucidula mucida]|nr:hypothetical protein CPB85DRAFT_1278606 [Mucidula mucida]
MTTVPQTLAGYVAVVTGGGTGIGRAIAEGLSSHGAKVYIASRRADTLTMKEHGGSLVPLVMDVTNEDSIKSAVKRVEADHGKLDILVNRWVHPYLYRSMSGGELMNVESVVGWEEVFKVNAIAPFFVVREFSKLLIAAAEQRNATASVINVSSSAANLNATVVGNSFAYGPSKAALEQLSRVMAAQFAKENKAIRVNVLAPILFASEIAPAELIEPYGSKPIPGFTATIPAKRIVTADEIAKAIVFLATAEYTNGVVLGIDGGVQLVNS